MTVTFNPGLIPAGSTSAVMDVAVDGTAGAGNKAITINAAGTGVTTASTTLTVTVTAAAAGGIVLSANPASLNATAGGAIVTSAIGITRTAPFAGAVALTATAPAGSGLTPTIAPASAPAGTNAATLSVTAAASAANGTYNVTVRGTGTGVADATAIVPVTVTGGSAPAVSFSFLPTPLPVTAGGATNASTVTLTRSGGFTGGVTLAVSSPQAGLTATLAPANPVAGGTATVTAQATAAVPAGSYNLTLTGTGAGISQATGTLPVVVSAAGGGGNVTVTFCAENNPLWVAIQSGSGTWAQQTPSTGRTYQFTFTSGTGGVALVQPDGAGNTELNVFYGSVAELTSIAPGVGALDCGGKTVNGTVVGVAPAEGATVNLGSSSASVTSLNPAFALTNVPEGSLDLIATRSATASFFVNAIILRRGLTQADNSTITPDLDFSTGFAPITTYTVALSNLGADNAIIINSFVGVNGSTSGDIGATFGYTGSAAVPYNAIPIGQLNAGELQNLVAVAGDAGNSSAGRLAAIFYHTPANKTIAMGPDLSAPTVTNPAVAGSNAWPVVQLPSQAEYNKVLFAEFDQGTLNRFATLRATAAYFGSLPATWNVPLPNLSTVTGWDTDWGLASGTAVNWQVAAQGGSLQFAPVADGSSFLLASVSSAPPTLRGLRTGADPFALQRRLLDAVRRGGSPLH